MTSVSLDVVKRKQRGQVVRTLNLQSGGPALTGTWICSRWPRVQIAIIRVNCHLLFLRPAGILNFIIFI